MFPMEAVKEIIMKDLEIFLDGLVLPEIDKKLNPLEEKAEEMEEQAEESESAEAEEEEKELLGKHFRKEEKDDLTFFRSVGFARFY